MIRTETGRAGGATRERIGAIYGTWRKWLGRLIPTREQAVQYRCLCWLGPLLAREWLWHRNRKTVAAGAAIGVFVGLIVPFGQIPLAALGAVVLRANLPVAAAGTLISNPLTTGPICWLAYQTGSAILHAGAGLPAGTGSGLIEGWPASGMHTIDWLGRIAELGGPLMLGLALFATAGALLTYLGIRALWRVASLRKIGRASCRERVCLAV